MATEVASLYATIGANLGPLNRGLRQASGALKKAVTDIGVGLASIAATAYATKKAFDFAFEGARVMRMRESFDRLGVGLDGLRDKAGGTVDDMTLMAATAKLLAGTTGDLNDAMKDAAPQLLEVARAAVKLDPSIGSVAFVYESLAKGIKKNQPLLIDNANIMVKVGAANEKMAEKLGKAVDELTQEEQQLALLEDTLRAGAVIMEQVGGLADDTASSFEQFQAAAANLRYELAEKLAPAMSKLAEIGTTLVTGNDNIRIKIAEQSDEIARATTRYEDYQSQMVEVGDSYRMLSNAAKAYIDEEGNLVELILTGSGYRERLVEANYAMSESEWALHKNLSRVNTEMTEAQALYAKYQSAVESAAEPTRELAYSTKEFADAISNIDISYDAFYELAVASGASLEQVRELATTLGIATDAEIRMVEQQYALVDAYLAGQIGAAEFRGEIDFLAGAQDRAREATLQAHGVIVDAGNAAGAAAGKTWDYGASLNALPRRIDIELVEKWTQMGAPSWVQEKAARSGAGVPEYQTGTMYAAEGLAYLHAGEAVLPRSEAAAYRRGGGGGNVTLNVYGTGNPESTASMVIRKMQERGLVSGALLR